MTIVFYDKSSAEILLFSSGFYFSVNIGNMAKIRNGLINNELGFLLESGFCCDSLVVRLNDL